MTAAERFVVSALMLAIGTIMMLLTLCVGMLAKGLGRDDVRAYLDWAFWGWLATVPLTLLLAHLPSRKE